jgi:uncharacterized membrane protein
MAEEDARHIREIERKSVDTEIKLRTRGQFFGLFIAYFGLVTSAVTAYLGHDTVAGVIGGTTIISLVAAFVIGRWKEQS